MRVEVVSDLDVCFICTVFCFLLRLFLIIAPYLQESLLYT